MARRKRRTPGTPSIPRETWGEVHPTLDLRTAAWSPGTEFPTEVRDALAQAGTRDLA